jgi:hypothetical protein
MRSLLDSNQHEPARLTRPARRLSDAEAVESDRCARVCWYGIEHRPTSGRLANVRTRLRVGTSVPSHRLD